MRAFIIRPFGTHADMDFDRVERELIQPAFQRLRDLGIDVSGGTTEEITAAGNIREDMFRLIAISDLVIADVTIHNANVFYELGIRHALCPQHTQLIRAEKTDYKYPFNLQTDRYFVYDAGNLAGCQEALTQAIRATLAGRRDSPIFTLLENLKPHGRGALVKIPEDFRDDAERASSAGRAGDLRLLAYECASFDWDQEGLALVGDAQVKRGDYRGAKETFELLLRAYARHLHANRCLATIYQRLALQACGAEREDLLLQSEQAIRRTLDAATTPADEAEHYSFLGSNAKNRWMDDYRSVDPARRQLRALESPWLERMLQYYLRACACDLNAHYPAVNALAFLKTQTSLARRFEDTWAELHDECAETQLKQREDLAERLIAHLRLTLRLDGILKSYQTNTDPWLSSSIADFALVTTPDKPRAVIGRYRQACANHNRFALEANRRNLTAFCEIGVFEPAASVALEFIATELQHCFPREPAVKCVLMFSGHRIDRPAGHLRDARFPRTDHAENVARQLIYDAVKQEVGEKTGETLGVASGACGGDILFHEVCAELGVRTELFLPVSESIFQCESVEGGGPGWVSRFQELRERVPLRVLQATLAFPSWLASKADYRIWKRGNLWITSHALAAGASRQTLIALLNDERGQEGDGGTKDMVAMARERGIKCVLLDARALL